MDLLGVVARQSSIKMNAIMDAIAKRTLTKTVAYTCMDGHEHEIILRQLIDGQPWYSAATSESFNGRDCPGIDVMTTSETSLASGSFRVYGAPAYNAARDWLDCISIFILPIALTFVDWTPDVIKKFFIRRIRHGGLSERAFYEECPLRWSQEIIDELLPKLVNAAIAASTEKDYSTRRCHDQETSDVQQQIDYHLRVMQLHMIEEALRSRRDLVIPVQFDQIDKLDPCKAYDREALQILELELQERAKETGSWAVRDFWLNGCDRVAKILKHASSGTGPTNAATSSNSSDYSSCS